MQSARKNHKTKFSVILCTAEISNKNLYFAQNFWCRLLFVVVVARGPSSQKGNTPSNKIFQYLLLFAEKTY